MSDSVVFCLVHRILPEKNRVRGSLPGRRRPIPGSAAGITSQSGPVTAPDCHSGRDISGIMCKNPLILAHFFQKTIIHRIYAKRGIFHRVIKTLTDAFGRPISPSAGLRHMKMKRTPVLGLPGTVAGLEIYVEELSSVRRLST